MILVFSAREGLMTEAQFKRHIFRRIREILPGCEIVRTDPSKQQGIPDNFILYGPRWATLEFKKSLSSPRQANQEFYICKLGEMGFAAFISPEIEDEVLDALEQALKPPRRARISQSKRVSLDKL